MGKGGGFEMDEVELIDLMWEDEGIVDSMDWCGMEIWGL